MKNNYEVTVNVRKELGDEVFAKTYKIALWDELVGNKNPKEHGLVAHVDGLITQLKLNSAPVQKMPLQKRQIYTVNFGSTIGSEITGLRPALVISPDGLNGEDVTVVPLTSALKEKLKDRYDLLVQKDETNKLYQSSWLRLRQIRSVSKNRLGNLIGTIKNEHVRKEISNKLSEMFAATA